MPAIKMMTEWFVTAVKTATYTAAVNDLVRCDPSGGAFAVNLPSALNIAGRSVKVKNTTTSTNNITVTPVGSETIDGAGTKVMSTARQVEEFISDGTNWMLG